MENIWKPQTTNSSPSPWVNNLYSHASKSSNHRKRFADISDTNLQIANDMLEEVKKLSKARRYQDAQIILGLVEKLLDNNANFQNVVGEVLADHR